MNMNNDNNKKEIEINDNCSKFVQKFRELLKSKSDLLKNYSIENINNIKRKRYTYISNKYKSTLPFIKNHKIFNSLNNNTTDNKGIDLYKRKIKLKFSPKKYLLNLETISHKKDTIFQINKISEYIKNSFSNGNKNEEKKNKIIERNFTNSFEKNKKFGITISSNNKFKFDKYDIFSKTIRENNDSFQNNSLDIKKKKKFINKISIKEIKNISSKNFYIKNIYKNIHESPSELNIKERKKVLISPSEIFKIELMKKQREIKKINKLKIAEKFKNSENEKNLINSIDNNYKIKKEKLKKSASLLMQSPNDKKNYQKEKNNNKNYYLVYPGNNGKLIKSCLLTRPNWEELPLNKKKHDCNLLWTPISLQINFHFHKIIEKYQLVNHFENHHELTNKRNAFINLLNYCELKDINLFSFYPLTVILPLNNDNFYITFQNFKNCYNDLPNLLEHLKNDNNNNKNNKESIDNDKNDKNINKKNNNIFLDKCYWDYFHIKPDSKLGSFQKIIIPKTHFSGNNLWLIKRINLNRGREIKILSKLEDISNEINQIKEIGEKLKYIIIQKYIERPLLYNGRKFDIRIWVLFTYLEKVDKFECYVFKEGHLKASSETFDINSLDPYIHLTNYSVQKYSKNFSKIEIGNEISFNDFQNELNKNKNNNISINFKKDIFFGKIIKIIEITANAAKNKINVYGKKNCFEIFGYDFILDEEYNPFLLEINTNPGYEESSPLIKMLVPRMIDDALRLTIDKTFERNDKDKNISKFKVEGYSDEENMWQKIRI